MKSDDRDDDDDDDEHDDDQGEFEDEENSHGGGECSGAVLRCVNILKTYILFFGLYIGRSQSIFI